MSQARALPSFVNSYEFLSTCIAFTLGLHNTWTFPGILHENGGICFLSPYFVCLLFVGFPLLVLELTVGRRFQGSCVEVYGRVNKYLWGIGLCMMVACLYTSGSN